MPLLPVWRSDVECLVEQGLQPRQVGVLLLDAFAQQTYYSGFTHGDPHPGNLLVRVRTDPAPRLARLLGLGSQPRPQLVLLDHGVYVGMEERLRRLYCQVRAAAALPGAAGVFGRSADGRAALLQPAGCALQPELLRWLNLCLPRALG